MAVGYHGCSWVYPGYLLPLWSQSPCVPRKREPGSISQFFWEAGLKAQLPAEVAWPWAPCEGVLPALSNTWQIAIVSAENFIHRVRKNQPANIEKGSKVTLSQDFVSGFLALLSKSTAHCSQSQTALGLLSPYARKPPQGPGFHNHLSEQMAWVGLRSTLRVSEEVPAALAPLPLPAQP